MLTGKTKTASELRRFGLAFGAALTVVGGLLLWRGRAAGPWVLAVAAVLALTALAAPRMLRPLETVMATLLRAVMTVVTYVVLTLAYFLVITPMGLAMRLFGKDLLHLRFEPQRTSYWVPVEPDGPASRPDKPY